VLKQADAEASATVISEGRDGECACPFPAAHGGLIGVPALPLRLRGRRLHHNILSGAIRFVRKGAFFNPHLC